MVNATRTIDPSNRFRIYDFRIRIYGTPAADLFSKKPGLS
jgi:hypothetical protein